MARNEFTKATKRATLARSEGRCEAVGAWYGLEPGCRCNAPLAAGVNFDHIDLDANSKDNGIGNCAAVCIPCHRHKTTHVDVPKAAKTLRQQDKARGIRKAPAKIPARGFSRSPKPDRITKQPLAPRPIYGLWSAGHAEDHE